MGVDMDDRERNPPFREKPHVPGEPDQRDIYPSWDRPALNEVYGRRIVAMKQHLLTAPDRRDHITARDVWAPRNDPKEDPVKPKDLHGRARRPRIRRPDWGRIVREPL